MEPITLIVTALSLGISTGLKSAGEEVIKNAYTSFKQFIRDKYEIGFGAWEKNPDSTKHKEVAEEQLKDLGAGEDKELIEKAKSLIDLINTHKPDIITAKNIDIKQIEAGYNIIIKNITTKNATIGIEGLKAGGHIHVEGLNAENDSPKA